MALICEIECHQTVFFKGIFTAKFYQTHISLIGEDSEAGMGKFRTSNFGAINLTLSKTNKQTNKQTIDIIILYILVMKSDFRGPGISQKMG